MLRKLKVYAGAEHPHGAQNPTSFEIHHAHREPKPEESR
jgi:ribosomal protein L13